MSLSPFDSFQSRFVTYLLNFPRRNKYLIGTIIIDKHTKILCNYRLHVKQISEKQAGTSVRISKTKREKKNQNTKGTFTNKRFTELHNH